jgi:hypothetical protein
LLIKPSSGSSRIRVTRRFASRKLGMCGRRGWAAVTALAIEVDDGLVWFWIGSHAEYDQLLG